MRSELNYSILICDFIFIIIILTPHLVSRNVLNRFYLYQYYDKNLSDYRERLTIKLVRLSLDNIVPVAQRKCLNLHVLNSEKVLS